MSESLRLFLDLGDVFCKGVAVRPGRVRRVRYPSVTAARLLDKGAEATDLLLDGEQAWPHPEGFDPAQYPRTRSYGEARRFLGNAWSLHGQPVAGARFAGYAAAAYGADRELLGAHPSAENIDALVRKAFLMTADGCDRADLTFVLDTGAKADAVQRYAERDERRVELTAWRFRRREPRHMQFQLHTTVIDSVECALAALPREVSRSREQGLLLLDVGYLRTKLALVTAEGCAHQQELDQLGSSDCVRRILRDGQDRGLFEDELAVMYALERSQSTIEVAGRRFDVTKELEAARRELASEIARAAQRALVSHFERSGDACNSVAILGGAAPIVGSALGEALTGSELGIEHVWVSDQPSFLLAQGARKALAGS